jgi:hypothetical protein
MARAEERCVASTGSSRREGVVSPAGHALLLAGSMECAVLLSH